MSSRLPPSFSALAWANLAAQSAEQLCQAAVPIVAVLLLGAGPGQVREPARAPIPARHPWLELREGTEMVWQHGQLRPILLTAGGWNFSWFVLQSAYVPYAVCQLSLDGAGVGLTLAAYVVGMVVGAL